jgi:UDP-glucose 4-epimerase
MKILVTGSAGFISGYLVAELLEFGHEVVGIDNFSKYGPVQKTYDRHPRYTFIEGDAKDAGLLKELATDCDQIVAGAAMIGGIGYFNSFAYDLLAENERITAATFDAAIWAFKNRGLKRIGVLSSSMVYESARGFPSREGQQAEIPPPRSTYGFQKLACEYFARGAFQQYGLPYTIMRPFNCVGAGERAALNAGAANHKLAMSHVVPDLIAKAKGESYPLEILGDGEQIRHYTYGGDLARGIRLCLESPLAVNEDFNLSSAKSTTVNELARTIWNRLGKEKAFRAQYLPGLPNDVQRRIPDVAKAKKVLGFEASTGLEFMIDEVIDWMNREGGAAC